MVTDKLQDQNDEIDFKSGLEGTFRDYEEDSIISATVDSIVDDVVYVDFGGKSEAKISVTEFDKKPNVGDKIDVYLVYQEGYDGDPVVSMSKALQYKEKEELFSLIKEETILEGNVVEVRKNGVMVKYGTLYGFIPLALWDVKRTEKSDGIKDKKVKFIIDRIAQPRDNQTGRKTPGIKEDFVGNRKLVLIKEAKINKSKIFENANDGDIVSGVVKNITDFGAFVDIGGVEGLLHIKDISWAKVSNVTDVIKTGDKVKVKILSVNKEKGQISLGMKQLEEQPWDKFVKSYKVEDTVKGTVTSVMPYGAFVKIIDGVEALLHISDMSWTKNVKHPKELVSKGQAVEVKILSIDEAGQKVNVSLKHLLENPWDKVSEKYKEGTAVTGKVKSVTAYGAFVELEEGVDALLHKDEISWTEEVDPVTYFKVGDSVNAEVIQCDAANNKIKVGIKQLSNDPWKNVPANIKSDDVVECEVKEINLEKGLIVEFVKDLLVTIPFSQIAAGRVDDVKATLSSDYKVGDMVKAVVRNIDLRKKYVSLSIRDFDKINERKNVQEYLKDKTDDKFTLGDMMKSKND